MYAASGKILAVLVFLSICALSCTTASAQSSKLARPASYSFPAGNVPAASASCFDDAEIAMLAPRRAMPVAHFPRPSCDTQSTAASLPAPCNALTLARTDCSSHADPVRADLEAIGKAGNKISHAREKVLEILESENACTAWYREKDLNPAAAFRTLSFAVDRKGEDFVRESRDLGSFIIFRSPYVARVMQANGPYATVTINAKGAFFSSMARVYQVSREGGPLNMARAPRLLHVGPYGGDTLPAQVVTLLHEFGHLLDLLPTDEADQDGKSVHNTDTVLHYCRSEIESRVRQNPLTARR
jgi:hypothetical protein